AVERRPDELVPLSQAGVVVGVAVLHLGVDLQEAEVEGPGEPGMDVEALEVVDPILVSSLEPLGRGVPTEHEAGLAPELAGGLAEGERRQVASSVEGLGAVEERVGRVAHELHVDEPEGAAEAARPATVPGEGAVEVLLEL